MGGRNRFFSRRLRSCGPDLEPSVGVRTFNQGSHFFEAISWIAIAMLLLTGIIDLILRNQEPHHAR